MSQTLYEKIWNTHVISSDSESSENQANMLYIDRHLIHEVTSPQAFSGLKTHGRKLRHPEKTFATMDHNVPTHSREWESMGEVAQTQMRALAQNCQEFGVKLYDLNHEKQGIIHVIGPELGLTLPGMTIVCGDSHTATHGAFGALAFGIGTSEVEQVFSTQTLLQNESKSMLIEVDGELGQGVSPKDIILAIIEKLGTAGGTGYVIEYAGSAIRALSMEARMTICNMSIELGARAGMVAPDQTTFDYIQGREYAPEGETWEKALAYWKTLQSDPDAEFDQRVQLRAENIAPQVTWGTNPGQVTSIVDKVPSPEEGENPTAKQSIKQALNYMGLKAGTPIIEIEIDKVFIGSCTNSRIEDLRAAASIAKGKRVAQNVTALIVPGSGPVKKQAEAEGLDRIFLDAGFEWREPGCSMCLAMNDDTLLPGERCASTSNRNFEGRQGKGGRTHLVSPEMAAAAAIEGHFVDVREYS